MSSVLESDCLEKTVCIYFGLNRPANLEICFRGTQCIKKLDCTSKSGTVGWSGRLANLESF